MLLVEVSSSISSWHPSTYRPSSISALCSNSQWCVQGRWAPVESIRQHSSSEIWQFGFHETPVTINSSITKCLFWLHEHGFENRLRLWHSALLAGRFTGQEIYHEFCFDKYFLYACLSLCKYIASWPLLDMMRKWEKCGFSRSVLCASHPIRLFSSEITTFLFQLTFKNRKYLQNCKAGFGQEVREVINSLLPHGSIC